MKKVILIILLTSIVTTGCQTSAKIMENKENEIVENEIAENEIVENEIAENEIVENEIAENEIVENEKKENEKMKNCINMYNEFLNSEISVSSDTDESSEIDIYDLFLLDENYNKFTFFDANQNGIPELHLSSMREYRILECIDNELKIIYSGSGYEKLLNNGALLYSRSGGAPEHISYKYTELDSDNNIVQITFEKYNTMNEKDDDDLYLFEDEELTKNDFEERTKTYLTVDSDLVIWSDYWTFLVENANPNSDNKMN